MTRDNAIFPGDTGHLSRLRSSSPMTFAVTGATGFLGSRLARRLRDAGHNVVVLKRSQSDTRRLADILRHLPAYDIDRHSLADVFRSHACSCVLHCATDYGRKPVARSSIIEANLLLPLRLLETAVDFHVPFFINTDTLLDKRISDYSLSKRHFREWLATFSGSIHGINVALEHFYGPGDDPTKFVSAMVRNMITGESRIPLTPGDQVRDFIHIDDVVEAFECIIGHHVLASSGSEGSPAAAQGLFSTYEIGSGQPVSIRTFMTVLQKLSHRDDIILDFGALPYRSNEVMHSDVALGPLMALGWRPKITLEQGLARTLAEERLRLENLNP